MKKIRIIALLLAVLTMTAALTGCGETDEPKTSRPGASQSAPETTPGAGQSTPSDSGLTLEPWTNSQGLRFELNEDGAGYTVSGIDTWENADIIIPSTYKGLPVTGIGFRAFAECGSLTSITIPGSVTYIGSDAFVRCYYLTSVTIPEGVTAIGNWAFASCTSLTSISIPEGVTYIGDGAFNDCYSLTSISIPEGVTYIGENAFNYCDSLTSITIPGSVTYIGYNPFAKCDSLTTIQYGGTMAEWEKVVQPEDLEDYDYMIICTDGTLADGTETNPGTTEPELPPQHVEWLPALTEEQLEMLGENDVLHDKIWLNHLHDANNTYTLKRHPGDASSISIYFLDEAKAAYFVFRTDDREYVIASDTYIYKYTLPDIKYYPTLENFDPNRYFSRGFELIYVIDENNHPELLDFFNDVDGQVYSDNEYQGLFGLTISDLLI